MESRWREQFEGDARRSVEAVVDLDSDRRTCPACFAEFAAGPTACPDCGLFVGG